MKKVFKKLLEKEKTPESLVNQALSRGMKKAGNGSRTIQPKKNAGKERIYRHLSKVYEWCTNVYGAGSQRQLY